MRGIKKCYRQEINTLQTIKRRKVNWLLRNCLLNHVIEGNIEGRIEETGRRGKRCKHLLDDLKEKTGYCKFKEEGLGHS